MKKREIRIFLKDILESAERIEQHLAGETKEEFLNDDEKQDAVTERLAVIGEAVKIFLSRLKKNTPRFLGKISPGCEISLSTNISA